MGGMNMLEQFSDAARKAHEGLLVDVGPDSSAMYVLTLGFLRILEEARVPGGRTEKEKDGLARIQDLEIRMPRQSSFHHLLSLQGAQDTGRQINGALEKLEAANAPMLGNVFRRIDFESEAILRKAPKKRQPLERLFDDLAGWKETSPRSRTSPAFDPGEGFEALLAIFAPGGHKPSRPSRPGEATWTSWKSVEKALADLVGPGVGARILDPACGRGSLLVETASRCDHPVKVMGCEKHPAAWALCRMNLVTHGIDPSHVIQGEPSEGGSPLPPGEFGLVVANLAARDEQDRPSPQDLWPLIRQLVDAAMEGKGRIGLVLPDLSLALSRDRPGREAVVGQNSLACVIEVKPENCPRGTPGPSILILERSREKLKRDPVLFVSVPETDLPRAVELYRKGEEAEGVSRRVGFDELERNDFRLQAPLYFEAPQADEPSREDLRRRVDELKRELEEVEERISEFLEELGLIDPEAGTKPDA